jgi:uncharacterized protein DUF488
MHGLRYESRPALGVPRRIRPLARTRRWLFEAAYRGVLKRAWRSGDVDALMRAIKHETVVLLCFEAEAGQCHRSLLASALSARAPVTFVDLDAGRVEHTDDHPRGRVGAVRAQDQVKVAGR